MRLLEKLMYYEAALIRKVIFTVRKLRSQIWIPETVERGMVKSECISESRHGCDTTTKRNEDMGLENE